MEGPKKVRKQGGREGEGEEPRSKLTSNIGTSPGRWGENLKPPTVMWASNNFDRGPGYNLGHLQIKARPGATQPVTLHRSGQKSILGEYYGRDMLGLVLRNPYKTRNPARPRSKLLRVWASRKTIFRGSLEETFQV